MPSRSAPFRSFGSTGAVLGRSLLGLRNEIDKSIAHSRLAGSALSFEPIRLEHYWTMSPSQPGLRPISTCVVRDRTADRTVLLRADPLILASAIMNLLTPSVHARTWPGLAPNTDRVRRPHHRRRRPVRRLPETAGDPFQPFVRRRSTDQAGLGLGLSIARKAVRAHGGDITLRNKPGLGCQFGISCRSASQANSRHDQRRFDNGQEAVRQSWRPRIFCQSASDR